MKLLPKSFKLTPRVKRLGLFASAAAAAIIILIDVITQVQIQANTVTITYSFHTYIALAIIVGLTFPAITLHLEARRKKLIDQALPRVLEDLAEGQEAGMTLLQALQESAKRDYGPISAELKTLVAQLTWGITFEDAFMRFERRIGTDLASRVTVLLLEAVRLGGNLKTAFRSTATFVQKMVDLRNDREAQLRPYLMVIFIGVMVFMVIIIIIYRYIFVQISATQASFFSASQTGFFTLSLSLDTYKGYFLDLSVIEALVGGLAIGELSEGSAAHFPLLNRDPRLSVFVGSPACSFSRVSLTTSFFCVSAAAATGFSSAVPFSDAASLATRASGAPCGEADSITFILYCAASFLASSQSSGIVMMYRLALVSNSFTYSFIISSSGIGLSESMTSTAVLASCLTSSMSKVC